MAQRISDVLTDCNTVIVPFGILYPKVQDLAMQNAYAQNSSVPDHIAQSWTETCKSFFQYKSRQGVKFAPDRCILGLLTDLADKGKQIAITTNLPRALIESAINLLAPAGDDSLLRRLTTSDKLFSSSYSNGSGTPLAHVLDSLQVAPTQTAIIVKNLQDIQSIQADKVSAIGYTAGNESIEPAELKNAGAVAVFKDCNDLKPN